MWVKGSNTFVHVFLICFVLRYLSVCVLNFELLLNTLSFNDLIKLNNILTVRFIIKRNQNTQIKVWNRKLKRSIWKMTMKEAKSGKNEDGLHPIVGVADDAGGLCFALSLLLPGPKFWSLWFTSNLWCWPLSGRNFKFNPIKEIEIIIKKSHKLTQKGK